MRTFILLTLLCCILPERGFTADTPKLSDVFTVYEFFTGQGYNWPQDTTGVIVLKDKRVFFFKTPVPWQEKEQYRKSSVWVPAPTYRVQFRNKVPTVLPVEQQKLPRPEDIFCTAVFPDEKGAHFTPDSLLEALPKFVQERPPQAELEASGDGQHGVFVLTDGRVIEWGTHSKRWILLHHFVYPTGFYRLPQ